LVNVLPGGDGLALLALLRPGLCADIAADVAVFLRIEVDRGVEALAVQFCCINEV
jgi:hypothetical protein